MDTSVEICSLKSLRNQRSQNCTPRFASADECEGKSLLDYYISGFNLYISRSKPVATSCTVCDKKLCGTSQSLHRNAGTSEALCAAKSTTRYHENVECIHSFNSKSHVSVSKERTRSNMHSGGRKKCHVTVSSVDSQQFEKEFELHGKVLRYGVLARTRSTQSVWLGKIPQGYPHRDPKTVIAQSRQANQYTQ